MAINQDILEQVFARLTTGQLLRSAALVCKDWKAAAYQSSSLCVTICGNSKIAHGTPLGSEYFSYFESCSGAEYGLDDQLARFKCWLASLSGKRSVEKLDLAYTHPDVFWKVSSWQAQPKPQWLLLELLPRGLSQLRSLRLTNILLRTYSWRELAHGCKQLTRLELEQPKDCPGSIEDLKPLSALLHLSLKHLKHFDGGREDWKRTLDSMGQLTHLRLDSCTYSYKKCWWGSDRKEVDPDTVRETVVAGLLQLKQLHLDLQPDGFHWNSRPIIIIGWSTFRSTQRSTAFHGSRWYSEWQQCQHEIDLEYLLKSKTPPQPAKGVQSSKHSQRWISSRAAKQWSNQSRQGGKAKIQQLRCFKQKL